MEQDVDVQFENPLSAASSSPLAAADVRPGPSILAYWAICVVIGTPLLWDLLSAWNVGATLAMPWLVLYLLASFAVSQVLYVLVARHDGRPVRWMPTLLFALGNGFAETLAFAGVYRLGEILGSWLVGLVFPAGASIAGFVFGLGLFIIYGGLIHGLYWLKILPPHLDDSPRSRSIRKVRPLFEVALVLGWSLSFWLNHDIWSVIFLHVLVDFGLMLRVRPTIFTREPDV
jgi:hypothetical protein